MGETVLFPFAGRNTFLLVAQMGVMAVGVET
jgi:hypothetical protein